MQWARATVVVGFAEPGHKRPSLTDLKKYLLIQRVSFSTNNKKTNMPCAWDCVWTVFLQYLPKVGVLDCR